MASCVKDAVLSDCGTYRYSLERIWNLSGKVLGFIMLNPSTADHQVDDPTIRRCLGFARTLGYGGIEVVNLYAYRATDPKELRAAIMRGDDIVGPENDTYLLRASEGDCLVAAWGTKGDVIPGRVEHVRKLLEGMPQVQCLGMTKDGHPKHPLYIPGDQALIPWWAR